MRVNTDAPATLFQDNKTYYEAPIHQRRRQKMEVKVDADGKSSRRPADEDDKDKK